ncbi:MbtH family protein [Rhizobium sp. VS19-DR104.2]|uniref:MbtH family protein n=1 Tax=unclassified Rhizobium TaxID=2613769 RepID=UPI001CC767AB|nr:MULTISPECIES: MbtH family protein [unclassified Rhizobium]MBZ5763784.1 MbtH family protein [Rhizobium sp. VS19-DR96]MBZ5769720.1 MbtH family protein [Rhizobium sp. VS19-DR129.2]MBZ5777266.1 MbtH family protein [Rhizobium sp. VS19-DRK62.2]MBZ5788390.1 MbtH family protein [Rhizobium sp. VS19-DR121]MBZ5805838.1 MbtH family protein [Rhizobium sp. VS19-DR181]
MANPFEDGEFLVLTNSEGQHSLWPASIEKPDGWAQMHGPDTRSKCLDYIDENWKDMRPTSLKSKLTRSLT